MKCVKCDGELVPVTIDNTEVDQCNKCSGIWFDFNELEQALASKEIKKLKSTVDNSTDFDSKTASCPRCQGKGKMIPVVDMEHNIHIDTCTICYGQWLDGGELEKLQEKSFFDIICNTFKLTTSSSAKGTIEGINKVI